MTDILILIAFCIFMFLVGMRIKQRWEMRKSTGIQKKILKNQRSKMAGQDDAEPPLVKERRLRRERRTRYFTIVQLVVLFGLLVFMAPALLKDVMLPECINWPNFILRCFIFLFTIYIFILGYLKVFGRKRGQETE